MMLAQKKLRNINYALEETILSNDLRVEMNLLNASKPSQFLDFSTKLFSDDLMAKACANYF